MLGPRQRGAEEAGRLIENLYSVEPHRWQDEGGIPEDLIDWCGCRCGIAVGCHVVDLLDTDVESWDVEVDSELDGGVGDECVDSYDKCD